MVDSSTCRPVAAGSCVVLDIALLVNRLSLGLYFLLAGVGKLRTGVGEFYTKAFSGLRPAWLPEAVASPFGHALPFIEVAVGALLVAGLLARLTAGVMALLLLSFSIALWQAGLFVGGAGPFHTNIVFFTLAILLAVTGPGRASLEGVCCRRPPPEAAVSAGKPPQA
jgi:putative oxidoreductase